jgi:hypothetical protein
MLRLLPYHLVVSWTRFESVLWQDATGRLTTSGARFCATRNPAR